MGGFNENIIKCLCDHCPNNTCTITKGTGLCYTEWLPKNLHIQALFTQQPQLATSSNMSSSVHPVVTASNRIVSYMINTNPDPIELEKRHNCYQKGDPLFLKTIICNETVSETSRSIRRCCDSGDYCNTNDFLLPSQNEAVQLFDRFYPRQTSGWLGDIWDQNLHASLGYKIFISMVLLVTLVYVAMTLTRQSGNESSSRRSATSGQNQDEDVVMTSSGAFKQFIGRLMGSRRANTDSESTGTRHRRRLGSARVHDSSRGRLKLSELIGSTRAKSTSCFARRNNEDSSSITIATDKVKRPDASAEPLITNVHKKVNIIHPIDEHHCGPFIGKDYYDSPALAAFQTTLGSGFARADDDPSSGSGFGQPYLTQRSISDDIVLIEPVGHGFYGVVWRGEYKGEPVAVKIFSPLAESSWEREAEIYQTSMLRHRNILGLIATDKIQDGPRSGYWLVTDFYQMGSLADFLKSSSITMADAVKMAFSIANGLSHLHVEIFGTKGKPAIAHRDLKSKNILIKSDGSCCIADLGMAVRHNSSTGVVDVPANTRVGTRRYLAPEVLDDRLNMMDFEGVKMADIYSMGLVFWEILRRASLVQPTDGFPYDVCTEAFIKRQSEPASSVGSVIDDPMPEPVFLEPEKTPKRSAKAKLPPPTIPLIDPNVMTLAGACDDYEVPYQKSTPNEPSVEDMRLIVCDWKLRPELLPRWSLFTSMRDYQNIMCECWYDKPQARLSALRVRKSMSEIGRKYFNMSVEYEE